jgi:hypothetical protein
MSGGELYDLVDQLPDDSVEPVARLVERAHDPVLAAIDAAPWDDESKYR